MAKKKAEAVPEQIAQVEKRSRISQADVPSNSVEEALRVPRALIDNYGGKSAPPLQLAIALKMTPTSGPFRMLCGSAIAYGLTSGGYNAKEIIVEPLSRRILEPVKEGDHLFAKREAALKPRILGE